MEFVRPVLLLVEFFRPVLLLAEFFRLVLPNGVKPFRPVLLLLNFRSVLLGCRDLQACAATGGDALLLEIFRPAKGVETLSLSSS